MISQVGPGKADQTNSIYDQLAQGLKARSLLVPELPLYESLILNTDTLSIEKYFTYSA